MCLSCLVYIFRSTHHFSPTDAKEESQDIGGFADYDLTYSGFAILDKDGKGITVGDLIKALERAGLSSSDPRTKELRKRLAAAGNSKRFSFEQYYDVISSCRSLVTRAVKGDLIIPDWPRFALELKGMHESCKSVNTGSVATYIPELAKMDPKRWDVSVCSVDGQRAHFGNPNAPFSIQSTSKPLTYCMAVEELGEKEVHKHVAMEPSGRNFNELVLTKEGTPHNPLLNAGAIMCCSLIKPKEEVDDRLDYYAQVWADLMASEPPDLNESMYLSEADTADRNYALAYMMLESGAFPKGTSLEETMEFYFKTCSLEVTTAEFSVLAATLANGGLNPLSSKRVLSPETVRSCLSMMYSTGMYDYSGEFAYTIGLPAKSGVSGAIMVVVPNVMGFVTFSPRLDNLGNSCKGIAFTRQLVSHYTFHNFDFAVLPTAEATTRRSVPRLLRGKSANNIVKRDPTRLEGSTNAEAIVEMCFAAYNGDLLTLRELVASGAPIDLPDFDGRTPLHVAAAEGHVPIVKYLLDKGAYPGCVDRWGRSPLMEAMSENQKTIVSMLETALAASNAPPSAPAGRLSNADM